MQTGRQQSWRLGVHAKAKGFNFRFRATSFVPTSTFCRFSIALKLRKFVLRVNSETEPTAPAAEQERRRFFRNRVIQVLRKFRARITNKNRPIALNRASNLQNPKDRICIGFWVVGLLAFLAQSFYKKEEKEIIIRTWVGFFVALLIKNYNHTGKFAKIIGFSLAAIVACPQYFGFHNCWDYMGKYATKHALEAWSRMANL